jgi:hypothetical protein
MKRRTLLESIAAALCTWPLGRLRLLAQVPQGPSDANLQALKALAEVVLPSGLGEAGRTAAVNRFVLWIRDYREGADRGYSYGASTLSQASGPSPAAAYVAQFALLDDRAIARGASSFASLSVQQRREIVEAILDQPQRVTNMPARPNGANLVADFMGYYFSSADGFDLAYDAAIGRDTCRGLSGSDLAPSRLKERLRPERGAKPPSESAWGWGPTRSERS